MKKWLVLVVLVLNGAIVFAQQTVAFNPVIDSVKAKWGKVKIVDGAAMISSNDVIEKLLKCGAVAKFEKVKAEWTTSKHWSNFGAPKFDGNVIKTFGICKACSMMFNFYFILYH